MVGSCFYCLSCTFAHSIVLFLSLGFNLHDVEAVNEKKIIHAMVGQTVDLSANLPTEGVGRAEWKYENYKVADMSIGVIKNNQVSFKDRLEFNQENFSLTLRNLNVQDSGDFSFISEVNNKQRETVIISLLVHERITVEPTLTYIISSSVSNESCTVLLNCSAASSISVTYHLTVGNQSHQGPRLQHTINTQDGDTTATCTVSNFVSNMSVSRLVTCGAEAAKTESFNFVVPVSAAGGGVAIMIIITVVALCICHRKQKSSASDSNELTVYADISDIAAEDGHSPTLKPCSLYDTITDGYNSHGVKPQTVYDEIQLNRMRKASVSPYQEIS